MMKEEGKRKEEKEEEIDEKGEEINVLKCRCSKRSNN